MTNSSLCFTLQLWQQQQKTKQTNKQTNKQTKKNTSLCFTRQLLGKKIHAHKKAHSATETTAFAIGCQCMLGEHPFQS